MRNVLRRYRLAIVVLCLSACTSASNSVHPTGTAPSSSESPSPADEVALCADVARIDKEVVPILDRLSAGTETKEQFTQDVLTIDLLANAVYQDVGDDPVLFEIMNNLSGRLEDVIVAEDMLQDPAEVNPATIPVALDAIAQADRAIADGILECPSPTPSG